MNKDRMKYVIPYKTSVYMCAKVQGRDFFCHKCHAKSYNNWLATGQLYHAKLNKEFNTLTITIDGQSILMFIVNERNLCCYSDQVNLKFFYDHKTEIMSIWDNWERLHNSCDHYCNF